MLVLECTDVCMWLSIRFLTVVCAGPSAILKLSYLGIPCLLFATYLDPAGVYHWYQVVVTFLCEKIDLRTSQSGY